MPDISTLLSIILFGFWVYCIVDVLMSDAAQVRSLNKWAWLAIVVLVLPSLPIGGMLWFMVGRPPRTTSFGDRLNEQRERYAARPPRPQAPRRRPTPVERVEDEASIRARIEERDRLLRQWEEEDRRKTQAAGPLDLPADSGTDGP